MKSDLAKVHGCVACVVGASIAAVGWAQSPTAVESINSAIAVKPLEIAQVFSDGSVGAWRPYIIFDKGEELPLASNITFGAAETTKLRGPGPDFIPTDGAECGGFGQPCNQPCSQTRRLLQSCDFTYGGMRISAVSSVNSTGETGNVTQVFLAWANKRSAGQLDDFSPPRVIGDTVIEVLIFDDWFDQCGPRTPNLIGGVLVNFGPLDGLCGTDSYYFSTLNLREFPDVCLTVPGPRARFGYEMAFWFDEGRSARAANNQAMLWGTKDNTQQGETLENAYIDNNYDGQYTPPVDCINLRMGGCPEILAAMVDFWGNTSPGNINLWDNGTFVTSLQGGCSNDAVSIIESPSNVFGWNTLVTAFHQADDFTVPSGQTWQIDDMRWYLYQTTAPPNDPITAAYVQVWRGPPGAGGSLIAGDMTTNRLLASEFMQIYRASAADPTNCGRAVKRITIDMSWLGNLSPGTYWMELGTQGNPGLTGPWAPPTVPRNPGEDNSRLFTVSTGVWSQNLDTSSGFPFDFPFELEGKIISGGPCNAQAYRVTISGSCPGLVTLAWSGAEPNRQQGIVYARNLGSFVIPNGICQGTQLGLGSNGLMLYAVIGTGASGSGQVSAQVGPGACGGFVQLITVPSCLTSTVSQVP